MNQFEDRLQAHAGKNLSAKDQEVLNTPLEKEGGLSPEYQKYLKDILELLEKGEVELGRPSSLINEELYERLEPSSKVKVEITARLMIENLRHVKNLFNAGDVASHQMETLLSYIKEEVKRLEDVEGDVLKI